MGTSLCFPLRVGPSTWAHSSLPHWPQASHMTTPDCKGGWEVQSPFSLAVCPEKGCYWAGDSGHGRLYPQLAHVAPAWGDQLSCFAQD